MENLNILGNSGRKRKSMYDPNLAERINKETEAEIRRKELEEKLKAKKLPKEQPAIIIQSPTPSQAPDFKSAFFLGDEFGKQINEKVQAKYGIYEAISKIQYDDNEKIIKGSTPFYVVAVNEIFQEQFPQFRTATQAELERILKTNTLKLEGHYEDTGLVWRSNANPNEYLAKDIHNQFKARGIEFKEGTPYVIPLHTLKLRKDEQSKYKLAFDITDLTLNNYFEAPVLNEVSQKKFDSKDIDAKTGLPSKLGDSGDRILYTRNSGFCRLYLIRVLSACSSSVNLACSSAYARVVVVSGEAAAQNFLPKNP